MKLVIAFVLVAVVSFAAVDRGGSHSATIRAMSERIERLTVEIHADNRAGQCDFAAMHQLHQLTSELAALNGEPYGSYPYTRTSGVVAWDDLPAYRVAAPTPPSLPHAADAAERAGRLEARASERD